MIREQKPGQSPESSVSTRYVLVNVDVVGFFEHRLNNGMKDRFSTGCTVLAAGATYTEEHKDHKFAKPKEVTKIVPEGMACVVITAPRGFQMPSHFWTEKQKATGG